MEQRAEPSALHALKKKRSLWCFVSFILGGILLLIVFLFLYGMLSGAFPDFFKDSSGIELEKRIVRIEGRLENLFENFDKMSIIHHQRTDEMHARFKDLDLHSDRLDDQDRRLAALEAIKERRKKEMETDSSSALKTPQKDPSFSLPHNPFILHFTRRIFVLFVFDDAIDHHRPFRKEFERYQKIFKKDFTEKQRARLEPFLDSGIPGLNSIRNDLDLYAVEHLQEDLDPLSWDEDSLWDQIGIYLRSFIRVQPIDAAKGYHGFAIFLRIDDALDQGLFQKALEEAQNLPPHHYAGIQDSIAKIHAHKTAREMITHSIGRLLDGRNPS